MKYIDTLAIQAKTSWRNRNNSILNEYFLGLRDSIILFFKYHKNLLKSQEIKEKSERPTPSRLYTQNSLAKIFLSNLLEKKVIISYIQTIILITLEYFFLRNKSYAFKDIREFLIRIKKEYETVIEILFSDNEWEGVGVFW